MILGLGTDIVNIERIEGMVKKFGKDFYKRILTKSELSRLESIKNINKSSNKIAYCARRFCAKEAFAKAAGVGLGRGINFEDITVRNDIMGKPVVELNKSAIEFICGYFKKESFDEIKIDISISDDYPFATAVAIISEIDK